MLVKDWYCVFLGVIFRAVSSASIAPLLPTSSTHYCTTSVAIELSLNHVFSYEDLKMQLLTERWPTIANHMPISGSSPPGLPFSITCIIKVHRGSCVCN